MYKGSVKFMFILLIVMLVYGCTTTAERTMDDKLKNSYFAMCYTSQFAKRFSLPPGKAMDLSFHKTIQPYLEHLDTKLKYIDESKDPLVDFP